MFRPQSLAIIRLYKRKTYQLAIHAFCVGDGVCIWCRVGGVGARSRKRGGPGYRLVTKHARTEMLGLLYLCS